MYPFSINEKILYGSVGVCEIREITQKDFGGKVSDYYVLVPVYRNESTVYVPVDSAALCEKMRKLPNKEKIDELLATAAVELPEWEDNKYVRRDNFNEILEKGSDKSIFSLARLIYTHGKKQTEKGKKLHITDERALSDAQKLIEEEIACVLEMPRESVACYIKEKVGS